jgi:hypothetical protein
VYSHILYLIYKIATATIMANPAPNMGFPSLTAAAVKVGVNPTLLVFDVPALEKVGVTITGVGVIVTIVVKGGSEVAGGGGGGGGRGVNVHPGVVVEQVEETMTGE